MKKQKINKKRSRKIRRRNGQKNKKKETKASLFKCFKNPPSLPLTSLLLRHRQQQQRRRSSEAMDRTRFDGAGIRSSRNYTCHRLQGALKHLASIDPLELCDEAKVEHCRATRDLSSCGRHVQSVLNSCGHASLCEECSQRCDVCPICRIPLPKDASRLRLRLYYECIEAGLISKKCDDRLQEKEDRDKRLVADIERLYALFDVALENNLVSLICHYVTDVCMDENAVSSDPIIAFLLDEVVVKDWCKRTFNNILTEIQAIYNLTMSALQEKVSLFLKFSVKLGGISNVIDVLESSFKGSLSAKLQDLHHLQECILKTKQHMEIMIWCIRHEFLESVKSRHKNFASWRALALERKSAAINRAWPDSVNHSDEYNTSTLFIEDALSNIEAAEQGDVDDHEEELALYLQKDGGSLYSRSKIEGMAAWYPFESLRAAADILFLRGSSDLVVAKHAIFLYFMFDRQWTVPDEEWRHIIDDFAATFGVTRHSLLESFTFFLLDDEGVPALKEACQLLPEISSPTIHPKVAQVLLERGNPDAALMVLRWSGQDGTQLISLREAVTAVRVRVECGLLTEAFTYQRLICAKIKGKKLRNEQFQSASAEVEDQCRSWGLWVETLVTEICCLCIRRNLVDRMIELPWSADEEKHLHKCLLDFAAKDPSSTIGSLLVVFYLQRHRYVEAYQIDQKLQSMEENFISQNSVSEEVLARIRSINHWRTCLVDKGIELLPDTLQQQVRTGKLPEVVVTCNDTVSISERSNAEAQEPVLTSLLANPPTDSTLIQQVDIVKPSVPDAPFVLGGSLNLPSFKVGHYSSPSSPAHFFNDAGVLNSESILGKKLKFDEILTPTSRRPPASVMKITRNLSREPSISRLRNSQTYKVSPEKFQNGFSKESYNFHQTAGNNVISLSGNRGILKDSLEDSYTSYPGNHLLSDAADRSQMLPLNDSMDITWSSHEERGPSTVHPETNGGPRWRSDDTSEDEDHLSRDGFAEVVSPARTLRGVRRSRRIARR
ncbi:E3 ubiquitin-protein ligase HOS1 [Capsicum annuum]|uniref:E3 ubiquitin-protein ligase HOS1 n=1 Tax=Capsicum annuum TaxID=4072 RepID=A0A2G3AF23_CAPAN|nr:E3 ubiquitin-protein ligase HOS1 [Capsicum annuum]